MRRDHLLYIDITTRCNFDCDFCMYKEERRIPKDLILDNNSRKVIRTLINDPGIDRITLSGEGEPFNNTQTLLEILSLSKGGRCFQILTNGVAVGKNDHLQTLQKIAANHGDQYILRLSADRFHCKKTTIDEYIAIIHQLRETPRISLALRSIVEDRELVHSLLDRIFRKLCLSYKIVSPGAIDDDFITIEGRIPVTYKSVFRPATANISKPFLMLDYMRALEIKYNRPFTLGNLRAKSVHPGLDVTIKPDGNIMFYGAEYQPFGNVYRDLISFSHLSGFLQKETRLRRLYEEPFSAVIERLSKRPNIKRVIEDVNNPYWVVKTIQRLAPDILEVLDD